MKTIREVIQVNLKRFLGNKSPQEVADATGIGKRTVEDVLKTGRFSQGKTLAALAKYCGVPETHLVVDLDEFGPKRPPNPREALEIIANALASAPPPEPGCKAVQVPEEIVDVVEQILAAIADESLLLGELDALISGRALEKDF